MSIIDTVTSITGWKWKLGAVAATASLIAVSGLLAYAQIRNYHLVAVNAELDSRINDPATGLLVTVAQCRTNAATAIGAVEQQNAALETQAAESKRALASTTAQLATAQRATRAAENSVAVLLSRPPAGDTLEDRIRDVDARLLETLK